MITFKTALAAGALLRAALILWGFHQDATSPVKYTDIDYVVFTDAARCLLSPTTPPCTPASGPLSRLIPIGDPYARPTYRYTPLIAIILTPNLTLHPAFGKLLFSLVDLVVATLLHRLLRRRGASAASATKLVSVVWLLNPIIANISTRGSAESLLGVLVVGCLSLAEQGRWDAAGVLFGLAVHLKIYPVIYGSSILACMRRGKGWGLVWREIRFVLVSGGVFVGLNLWMYAIWGEPFITHTYLYHIHRLDHRHNFSPYFYQFYLSSAPDFASATSSSALSVVSSLARHPLAAFLPQIGLSTAAGLLLGARDLSLAWFVQTVVFVTFNKVCTSQYFLWYLWLLPPVLPNLTLSRNRAIALLAVWVLAQALWLSQAARLELAAQPVYREVWVAGIVFFGANCWVLGELVGAYRVGDGAADQAGEGDVVARDKPVKTDKPK